MIQMMKARAGSGTHIRYVEAELLAKIGESITHIFNVLGVTREARTKMLSSHFFAEHIFYADSTFLTTNFHKLINLVISCGRKDLEESVCRAAKNASYTSSDPITDFVEKISVGLKSCK